VSPLVSRHFRLYEPVGQVRSSQESGRLLPRCSQCKTMIAYMVFRQSDFFSNFGTRWQRVLDCEPRFLSSDPECKDVVYVPNPRGHSSINLNRLADQLVRAFFFLVLFSLAVFFLFVFLARCATPAIV